MKRSGFHSALIRIAGGALLIAMLVDTVAMIGRQIEVPLIGSIELVQVAVLIAGSGALIVATLAGAHARVNLLLELLPDGTRRLFERLQGVGAAVLFLALSAASLWIAFELWSGHEESELLRIPYRPLRLTVAFALLALLVIVVRRLFAKKPE